MPRRRRREQNLERVLGTPALFATAYGNVGSSIYYALVLTAVYALGLTPVVFVVDFATQVFLVTLGFVLVVSPHVLVSNVHWGVAPTWSNLAIAIPVAM